MQQIANGVRADLIAGANWRKSGRSAPGGNCVEMTALASGGVAVRNSRFPSGPALVYNRADLASFLEGVKEGEFDELATEAL
ncbi:DUF397 domain-containing protein [Streptomyces sp. TR06-5]|uniref:DUF397 domain-containing protein n=1 Tax=unclassified Streptomyces TaxID=2593676 RepID=UPI00399FB323